MSQNRNREPMMRAALIIGTLLLSWLGMMAIHEAGHVIGAWLSGGTVRRVVLHPFQISQTDVRPNPHPMFVVWAGPIVGTAVPLLLWGVTFWQRWSWTYLARFFAGFCSIANAVYIGVGSFMPVGDAKVMLAHGSPSWALFVFGVSMVPLGFSLWHGEGRHFGLGPAREGVNHRHIRWIYGLLTLVILGELSLS